MLGVLVSACLSAVIMSPSLDFPRTSADAAARALRRSSVRPISMCSADETLATCMAMKVSELKAELDLRKVDYTNCFEKEELARQLADARRSGKADPDILDAFNKQSAEQAWAASDGAAEGSAGDEGPGVEDVTAGDGGVPGGLSPDAMQDLANNPEAMTILRNPKMQEIMKEVMQGGPEAAAKYMDDPEVRKMLQTFQGLAGGAK